MSTNKVSFTSDVVRELENRIGLIRHLFVDDNGNCYFAAVYAGSQKRFVIGHAHIGKNGDFNCHVVCGGLGEHEAVDYIDNAQSKKHYTNVYQPVVVGELRPTSDGLAKMREAAVSADEKKEI